MDHIFEKLPRVDNCCFCCTKRTGALIIGYLGLIFGTLGFISNAVSITQLAKTKHNTKKVLTRFIMGVQVFDLLILLCIVFISTLLLIGIRKKNTKYILIWMYGALALIALKFIVAIIMITCGQIVLFISSFLFIGLYVYYIIVVNSYKVGVESEADGNF